MFDVCCNEYQLIKSMVESLEGFLELIKFLSIVKFKEWNLEMFFLLDFIYVKEDYWVVIENYFEFYLNYYVVFDLEVAYKVICLFNSI